MNYISSNLGDFEFHDAELSLISFSDNTLTVSAELLNIHKGTAQNSYPTDMEIERAVITLHAFSLFTFDQGNTWTLDAEGKWVLSEEREPIAGKEALQKLLCELKGGIHVYSFEPFDDTSHYMDAGSSEEPWFCIRFAFKSVTVEWDEYRTIAWYEERLKEN